MTFLKNFVNVLSIASISFILLSAVFAFIVYFNLLDGKIKPDRTPAPEPALEPASTGTM